VRAQAAPRLAPAFLKGFAAAASVTGGCEKARGARASAYRERALTNGQNSRPT